MRGLSLTAFIFSNLTFFAVVAVSGCVIMLTMMLVASLSAVDFGNVHDIVEGLSSSQISVSMILGTAIIFAAIAAGYTAARIAVSHGKLNGALSSAVWTLMSVITGSNEPGLPMPMALQLVLLFGCPIFGALGGSLALYRRPAAPALTAAGTAAGVTGPIANAGLIFVRCLLVLPVAGAVYTIAVISAEIVMITSVAGGLWIAFGVALAITLGTSVAPRQLRQITGYFLMVLILLASVEEFARNAVTSSLSHNQLFVVFANIFGTALSYVAMLRTFPGQFGVPAKWWWLSTRGYVSWSSGDRRVRRELFGTGAVIWVAVYFVMAETLSWAGVETHMAAVGSALMILPLALFAARPLYGLMRPGALRQADEHAAIRYADVARDNSIVADTGPR